MKSGSDFSHHFREKCGGYFCLFFIVVIILISFWVSRRNHCSGVSGISTIIPTRPSDIGITSTSTIRADDGRGPASTDVGITFFSTAVDDDNCKVLIYPYTSMDIDCMEMDKPGVWQINWNWREAEDMSGFYQYCILSRETCELNTKASSKLVDHFEENKECALIYSLHGMDICYDLTEHFIGGYLKGRILTASQIHKIFEPVTFWFISH